MSRLLWLSHFSDGHDDDDDDDDEEEEDDDEDGDDGHDDDKEEEEEDGGDGDFDDIWDWQSWLMYILRMVNLRIGN